MSEQRPARPASHEALARSLNLLPWFLERPGATVFEAARDLGRTPREIIADLQRLHCCGLPGLGPEHLVDVSYGYEAVEVMEPQGMDRALRLTEPEAIALLMSLDSLLAVPGLVDADTVRSAAAKLRRATAGLAELPIQVAPARLDAKPEGDDGGPAAAVARAIRRGRTLRFTYRSGSRDELSRREVSPGRIFSVAGHGYLGALEADGWRSFRLDRMSDAEPGEDRADPAAVRHPIDPGDPFGLADARTAYLELREDAQWLMDYHPITRYRPRSGSGPSPGTVPAKMPYGSEEWLIRFAVGQADRLRIIRPVAVARAVRRRAVEGLAGYA